VGLGLYFIGQAIPSRFSRPTIHHGLIVLSGFLAPILLVGLFFAFHHALGDLLSAVFVFNRIYVGELHVNILQNFKQGLYGFPSLGFWLIAGSAVLISALTVGEKELYIYKLWVVLGLSFIAELALSNLSGAAFKHYFLTWLPFAEFTSDIANSMPVIVDTSEMLPLEKIRRDAILAMPKGFSLYGHLQPFFDFFDANYRQAAQLSHKNWIVFLPIH
jgi:hypothetical protein